MFREHVVKMDPKGITCVAIWFWLLVAVRSSTPRAFFALTRSPEAEHVRVNEHPTVLQAPDEIRGGSTSLKYNELRLRMSDFEKTEFDEKRGPFLCLIETSPSGQSPYKSRCEVDA